MCGIAGFINFGNSEVSWKVLKSMTQSIAHRGPDDVGYALWDHDYKIHFLSDDDSAEAVQNALPNINSYHSEKIRYRIGFAHRRFSIIETSTKGHQPFVHNETINVLTFNGEIFNYIELREELESAGFGPFHTDTDTEVILVAYAAWGESCFRKFNGFWSLVLFDRIRMKLVFSRDRFGKKPLYTRWVGETLYFCSEIRGLSVNGYFPSLKLNHNAAMLYLFFDRRNTIESCIWEEIELMPPGHIAILDIKTHDWISKEYWEYPNNRKTELELPLNEAIQGFKQRLKNAVSLRLRADVPLCANLSGGIDSSAIVCLAQSILGNQSQLHTNLIRYSDAPELDEDYFANKVSNFAGTNHQELIINSADFIEDFLEVANILEEPVHTPAFFTQFKAWKLLHDQGYRVVLHGSAADELLLGYQYSQDVVELNLINNLNFSSFKKVSDKNLNINKILRLTKRFGQGQLFPNISNQLRNIIGLPDRRKVIIEDISSLFLRYFHSDFVMETLEARRILNSLIIDSNKHPSLRIKSDFETLRIGFWNNVMDKSSMHVPIEIRMPFMDFELINYAMQVPVSYLYRDGWSKYILRKSVDDLVPSEVNWCKKKRGFTAPIRQFLNGQSSAILELLSNTRDETKGIINIDNVLKNYDTIPERMLWRIINLCACLKVNR